MLWNVNSGYLQAVKFYDNLEFTNYTITHTIMPHILHIPSLTHRPLWGGKAQASILKLGKLRLVRKSGTSPSPTPSHPSPGPPGMAMDRVGGSPCLPRVGQQPGMRTAPSSAQRHI